MTQKVQWHHIFAAFLEELLAPVGIKVEFAVPISPQPPEIDIILIQQATDSSWTAEQKRYLPDGIRDSLAHHVPIELKFKESNSWKQLPQKRFEKKGNGSKI